MVIGTENLRSPATGPSPGPDSPAEKGDPGRSILFVSKTAEVTGPTNSLGLLLDRLRGEHDVRVLLQGTGPFQTFLESREIPYRTLPSMGPRSMAEVARILRSGDRSLVYANETSRSSRNVCVTAKALGIPFVSHVRSMGWRHGWTRLGHLRAADAVIAVSNSCGRSVSRFVRADNLHVVHNGVPDRAFSSRMPEAERAEFLTELGIRPSSTLVVHVSHVTPRKGQLHALEALSRTLGTDPAFHLVLLGALDRDPAYVQEVRELMGRPPLEGRVSLVGFRTDVSRFLRAADILLHTALADPHPRAVLEGMATGLPVVAFPTDGVSETVMDGVTGFLVDSSSPVDVSRSLQKLGRDGRLRRKMGEAGRERVREFFREQQTADRVAEIVERVLVARGT
jgi:glycosyltransferase involved in cell wall biosynthesis